MTTDLIRKQVYINRRQQLLLKQLARRWGVSEAEIIRRAIDREMTLEDKPYLSDSHSALEEIFQAATARRGQTSGGEPYHFDRADVYEERENRWKPKG